MAQTGKKVSNTRKTGTTSIREYKYGRNSDYIYDNTARKLDVVRKMEEEPKRLSDEARRNREKARHMSLGFLAYLVVAMTMVGVVLYGYVTLQADYVNSTREIARLESTLNDLKLSNDEEYNRVTGNVDLEEVRRVAIGELGMTYAQEGQIITYSSMGTDYMRQAVNNSN